MRRRGRSPTERFKATNSALDASEEENGDNAVILDTDDQEELIRTMEEEAKKQSQLFQTAFSLVGGFAMVVSLFVYPFLCHDECSQRLFSCWTHAIVSCGTHGLSVKVSRSTNRYPNGVDHIEDDINDDAGPAPIFPSLPSLFGILVVLHVLPLVLWVLGAFDRDVEHFHLGLVLGNLVTLLGSFLLYWDAQSTQQALNDLHGAKYEHKSL